MTDLVKFFKNIGRLKKTKRAGWVVAGVKNSESVADHSFGLAILGMILGDKFGVDTNKLVRMALVDDLAEAITGDLVYERGDKVLADHDEKMDKERRAVVKIFVDLENGDDYIDLWDESQKGETREAKCLKQLDKLEMVMQALEYEGETESEKLGEFWVNAQKYLKEPELVKIFEEISRLRLQKKSKI